MKKKLYFVGTKDSVAKNSWLAIASVREVAEQKMSELSDKGACCIVEKVIDLTKRKKK
jgi:hypothetical protein